MDQYMFSRGNLGDGFTFHGPFQSETEAKDAHQRLFPGETPTLHHLLDERESWLGKDVYIDTGDGVDGEELYGHVEQVMTDSLGLRLTCGKLLQIRWDSIVHIERIIRRNQES